MSDNNQVNILVKPPSLFAIKTFFKLQKINLEDVTYNFQDKDYHSIGLQLGLDILKNKKQILQQKKNQLH